MTPWVCIIGLLIYCSVAEGYRFNRLDGLLPSFDDPGYPNDDYIDNNGNFDTAGVTVSLDFALNVFGYSLTSIKAFDTGFIVEGSYPYQARNGNAFAITDYPHFAPNWMEATAGLFYHMAYRKVTESMSHRQHDLDRINKEVNQARGKYPETWKSQAAFIITWKISNSAGEMNKFQAVLASGVNTADNNNVENYVLYLYASNQISSGQGYVSAFVNGKYQGAATKYARLCDFDDHYLNEYSNYKCGTKGIYVFTMASGTECTANTDSQCALAYGNPNCLTPFVEPQDTCTESAHCTLNKEETVATINLYMIHYPFGRLSALNYLDFKSTGTDDEPLGAQTFITNCQKDLANPGGPTAHDTFAFNVSVNPVDAVSPCGVYVNTIELSISYAFSVYDPNNPEVDLDGKFIFFGKLYCKELANAVTQDNDFNDFEVTRVPVRSRTLSMFWIDRPDPSKGLVLDSAKVGRDLYAKLCYVPGTPFVLHVNPFGVKAQNCYISNNADFNDYPTSKTGSTKDRTEQVIANGCVSRPSDKSFYFKKTFEVHKKYNTKGSEWCLVTGKMEAAVFNDADKKLYLKCLSEFCTVATDTTCNTNCPSGGRSKRGTEIKTMATGTETLIVELDIESNKDDEISQDGLSDDDGCINFTLALTTIVILISITMIACFTAIVIFLKIQRRSKMIK